MILIRFLGAGAGRILSVALVLIVPIALLLLWRSEQQPPPKIQCVFGSYDFEHHDHFVPEKGGVLPRVDNPYINVVGYAVKITVTNESSNWLDPSQEPTVALQPSDTPWQVPAVDEVPYPGQSDQSNQYLSLGFGESVTVIEPMIGGTYASPAPTGCSVTP